jgi:hypothetical protein
MQNVISGRELYLRNAASLQDPKDRAIAALNRAIDSTVLKNAQEFSNYVRAELIPSVKEGKYAMWPGIWKPKGGKDFSVSNLNSGHWTVLTNRKTEGLEFFHIVQEKARSGTIFYRVTNFNNSFKTWDAAVFSLIGQMRLKAADPTQAIFLDLLEQDYVEHDPLIFPTDIGSYNTDINTLASAYAQQQREFQARPQQIRRPPSVTHGKIPAPPAIQYEILPPNRSDQIQYSKLPGVIEKPKHVEENRDVKKNRDVEAELRALVYL